MSPGVTPAPNRQAGSRPYPEKPVGAVDDTMPFDHIVVVMMENHSFDNLLGALPLTNPLIDGLSFHEGKATNSNPGASHMPAELTSFPLPDLAQGKSVSQSWKATHEQINGGLMSGFVRTAAAPEPMGYYTPELLPFAYSLASTFTVANRWFSSVPGPTYPNRRFLLAGTAFGGTTTNPATLLDPPPPSGTLFDHLSAAGVSWSDYFTDVPMTTVIPSIVLKHPGNHHPISKFFHDCNSGTLPSVSFVDPGIGVASSIVEAVQGLPSPLPEILAVLGAALPEAPPAETEEDPQNMYFGEAWAYGVIQAVLQSPKWSRTLLVYTYDEHGGYYDHVPPPGALPPDRIAPALGPDDPAGGYDSYGPRVPAIIVSPYAKRGGVSNLTYDHTSILATIERKWNLPALTARDANARHIMDCLDPAGAAPIEPPHITPPTKPAGL